MQAAKYLGVPPWVLYEQPRYWLQVANEAMQGESIIRQRQQASSGTPTPTGRPGTNAEVQAAKEQRMREG